MRIFPCFMEYRARGMLKNLHLADWASPICFEESGYDGLEWEDSHASLAMTQ